MFSCICKIIKHVLKVAVKGCMRLRIAVLSSVFTYQGYYSYNEIEMKLLDTNPENKLIQLFVGDKVSYCLYSYLNPCVNINLIL